MRIVNRIVLIVAAICFYTVSGCSEPAHTKKMTDTTRDILQDQFHFSEILEIVSGELDFASVVGRFDVNPNKYKHFVSKQEGKLRVEAYSILKPQSPILDYSFFFYDELQTLIMIDATINQSQPDNVEIAKHLIAASFQSASAEGAYRLHFLGIYPLDDQRTFKIGILEATSDKGADYAIRYAISVK